MMYIVVNFCSLIWSIQSTHSVAMGGGGGGEGKGKPI